MSGIEIIDKIIDQHTINGATLLGTAIALFALKEFFKVGDWQWYGMIIATISFMALAFLSFIRGLLNK